MHFVIERMHARAIQVYGELLVLMENGFADGAMARWRTLHEISVVATVIVEGGENIARRFLAHEAWESFKAMEEYDFCQPILGYKPTSSKQRKRITENYDLARSQFGKGLCQPYGWASELLAPQRPVFKELEKLAGRAWLHSHYKFASSSVHADVTGFSNRLCVLGNQSLVLAGASNAGLVEPGQNAAMALIVVTELLVRSPRTDLDRSILLAVLVKLRDAAVGDLMRAHRRLQRDVRRMENEATKRKDRRRR